MVFDFSRIASLFKKDLTGQKKGAVVGVDVGSSSIKIVQVHKEKNVPILDTYGELQLGPYAGVDIGRAANVSAQKLTEALVDIMRESQATSKNVSLAISFNSSFTTVLSFPTKEMTNIEARLPVEARKYIPISLSEVTMDWFPIGSDKTENTTDILLVAIHNETLHKLQTMVQGAGLSQKATELEVFSTIRSSVGKEDGVTAIIDLGAGSTKLYIAQNGVIAKTHSLRMNGVELTNALVSTLGTGFEEAEAMKRKIGLFGTADDSRSQKALTVVLERSFKEILTFIKRYSEEEHIEVEKIFLSGSGALLGGIDMYAKEMLGRSVVISDPFSKLSYPAFLEDTLKEAGSTFAVAVGAALGGLIED